MIRRETPDETQQPDPIALEDDELTVQHERHPISAWTPAKAPERPWSPNGSVLKLLVVGGIGTVLLSLGFLLLTRSSPRMVAVTAAQPVTAQKDASFVRDEEETRDVALEPRPEPNPAQPSEDHELKTLREMRVAATRSERSELLAALAGTEQRYPNDYRFPYERAKLAIKERQKTSHDDAFAALALAAQKAIQNGKAREMLENLRKDGGGDFQKLSHGHREWAQLQEALKSKNARVLNAKMGM
jgi:hypothetical protein